LEKHEKPIEFNSAIELPAFHLLGYNRLSGAVHFTTSRVVHFTTGSFSQLRLEFVISQYIDFYMAQVFVPAGLVVIIIWVPFWLNRGSQTRVALGVTTVLTMTTLTTTLNTDLPKISQLTALDVYLFVCFAQVFLSLIEYATIGYYDV
ncbi:PREDICTED: gamma-aminobutyric acid receptor subunit beta-like, partial [Rhagoletis zephyria]|uniref:gamma-aminobutyric acid receptor subunit beta-like n=1 Tax=Rhagoletis zephyria TaxID=28612 RepID=UPI000811A43C